VPSNLGQSDRFLPELSASPMATFFDQIAKIFLSSRLAILVYTLMDKFQQQKLSTENNNNVKLTRN
jgi:hypothetical protein